MKPFDKITTTRLTSKALPLVALLLLVGCNKKPLGEGEGGDLVAINLSVKVSDNVEQSKAPIMGVDFFTADGAISDLGLFYRKADGTPYTTGAENMLMRLTGNGSKVTMQYSYDDAASFVDKLYFRSNETVKLSSYYPRMIGATATSIPIDLTTDAQKKSQSDILYSPEQSITSSTPVTSATVQFKHAYALLEFQIKKKGPQETQLLGIDVVNKAGRSATWLANKGTFNPQTGEFSPSQWGSVSTYYTSDNTLSATDYTTFRVMVPPFSTKTYVDGDIEVQFRFTETPILPFQLSKAQLKIDTDNQGFRNSSRYTFTLLYQNMGEARFSLESWDTTHPEISASTGYLPIIIKHGGVNGKNTVGTKQTKISYDWMYGQGNATNGKYSPTTAEASANEPPYYRLEIAKTDAYNGNQSSNWNALQGSASDHSDNICVKTHGKGWRLPRFSELRMLVFNLDLITANTNDEFTSLETTLGTLYCSATEYDADVVMTCQLPTSTIAYSKSEPAPFRVRCVKEAPLHPTIMEFGGLNGKVPKDLTTSTKISYNGWYGYDNTATNGAYQSTIELAYANEPPYYRLEIAEEDALSSSSPQTKWKGGMGTRSDHSDNICVQTHGRGWRVPRMSELRMLLFNINSLQSSAENEFKGLSNNRQYCSATESDNIHFWGVTTDSYTRLSDPEPHYKSDPAIMRCVRELPLP